MENLSIGFSKATFMPFWNEWNKAFSALITQNRILDDVSRYSGLGKQERAYLAFLGIDESMAERIARQFEEFGETDDAVRLASTEDWTDPQARRAYRAAINKDVDSTIVTKGIGDVPLWVNTPLGGMVAQFKSFALASHQRAFLRSLQAVELGTDGGRAAQLAGFMSATAVGMVIYWLKTVESNRMEDISDNPGRWLAEGLDRSGIFTIAFEVNNTIEKYLGIGAYGAMAKMFPDRDQSGKASRFASRNVSSALTGPTGGMIQDLVTLANGLKGWPLSDSDVNAAYRLIPFLTLPVLRSVVEWNVKPGTKALLAEDGPR
jgi:hypothetical protein